MNELLGRLKQKLSAQSPSATFRKIGNKMRFGMIAGRQAARLEEADYHIRKLAEPIQPDLSATYSEILIKPSEKYYFFIAVGEHI